MTWDARYGDIRLVTVYVRRDGESVKTEALDGGACSMRSSVPTSSTSRCRATGQSQPVRPSVDAAGDSSRYEEHPDAVDDLEHGWQHTECGTTE